MFGHIRLSRHASPPPAGGQPSHAQGAASSKATTSGPSGSPLTARGSPTPGTGAGSLPPRRPLLQRSDALSAQARADVQAAFPRPQVRFAAQAQVVDDGQVVGRQPVDFGPKEKPQRIRRPVTSPPAPAPAAAAPAPEPPRSPERPSGTAAEGPDAKRGVFGNLFRRSHGSSAHQPTPPSSPGHPAASAAATGPGPRAHDKPVDKFNSRLATFMKDHPDEGLKARLLGHLVNGHLEGFKKEATAALNTVDDTRSFALLQSMLGSLSRMGDEDLLNIHIVGYKPSRPRA